MFAILLFYTFLQSTGAIIYRLNASEHSRLPPLLHFDPYGECQLDADSLYCAAEFELVSDKPSPLLNMIKEYSEHRVTHYNRTKLHYGICVTQTCKQYYNKTNGDLKLTLEACLNESLSNKYQLKTKILDEYYCNPPGKPMKDIDQLDIIIATICVIILVANIVGSLCDFCLKENRHDGVLRFILCFSLKRNWNKLTAPVAVGRDPRVKRLKSFHGMKVFNISLVIIGHGLLILMTGLNNPEFIEELYTTFPIYGILNVSLIMQTFFMTSAFLLVYNWLLYSEDHEPSWSMLPKHVIIRWLRLTPAYALVLGLTATWFGHLTTGPWWGKYIAVEMYDCRRYWWYHLLYINNYFNNSQCMVPSWYLASDTQLYYMAVIIYLACRTARSRKIVLSTLFIIGIIIPAAYVYLQDLDGIQTASPELADTAFMSDPHFNTIYKRSHTNIPGCVVGIALGYLIYHWQQKGVDLQKYQTLPYRILYWSLVPLIVLCFFSGAIFYLDGPRLSIYIRMAFSAFMKPLFALIISGLVIGFIFKFENVYRGMVEWRGANVFSRLSYSAYLLHLALVRNYVASQTYIIEMGYVTALEIIMTLLVVTFAAAFFLWMLVEAPISNVLREYLFGAKNELNIGTEMNQTTSIPNEEPMNKNEDV